MAFAIVTTEIIYKQNHSLLGNICVVQTHVHTDKHAHIYGHVVDQIKRIDWSGLVRMHANMASCMHS